MKPGDVPQISAAIRRALNLTDDRYGDVRRAFAELFGQIFAPERVRVALLAVVDETLADR